MQGVRNLHVGYATRWEKQKLQVWDRHGCVVREKVRTVAWAYPALRLCGCWMNEAGFHVGDGVRVEVSEGRLVIVKEGGGQDAEGQGSRGSRGEGEGHPAAGGAGESGGAPGPAAACTGTAAARRILA